MDAVFGRAWSHAAALSVGLAAVAVLAVSDVGWTHAFPDHSEPRVGHAVSTPPSTVRVWFDGAIEPVFSTMRVEDANGQRVDRGDAHVDPSDSTLLEVTLTPLPKGAYQVTWSVVARDGHRTEGRFPFRVE